MSKPQTALLASSLTLPSGLRLANRIAKAAMSETLGDASGAPDGRLWALNARFAGGGLGLQITGNVMVDPAHVGEPGNVVADRAHLAALTRWAASSTAPTLVQLNHPGRQSPKSLNKQPVSPSSVGLKMSGLFAVPRALGSDEVRGVVDQFAAAARLMQQAGFAGVQIHGAHGYLVSQFLSPLTNRRDDEWGGSLDNRARFLLEIVRAVRAATRPDRSGAGFTVAVKLNSADFQRGGFSSDDAMTVASWLDDPARTDGGIDLLEISGGTYESPIMARGVRDSTRAREAYFLEYAEGIRKVVSRTPLMLTGGFRSAAGMESALASGAVDVVGLARPLAAEPDLPRRLLDGSASEALPPPAPIGVRMLDDLIGIAWYQQQMARMARGADPLPGLSRVAVLVKKLVEVLFAKRATPAAGEATTATPAPATANEKDPGRAEAA